MSTLLLAWPQAGRHMPRVREIDELTFTPQPKGFTTLRMPLHHLPDIYTHGVQSEGDYRYEVCMHMSAWQ